LDQFAQGLILCLVGPFTKLNPFLMELSKTYVAEVYFGKETDTLDPTGTQVSEGRVPSLQEILALVPSFIGDIQQVPPLFSALKIKGKRASDRVRSGEKIEISPRGVTIHSLELLSFNAPKAVLKIRCSKGTYIRSLARDLAEGLGTCAHLSALKRVSQGQFELNRAVLPSDVKQESLISPLEFAGLYPSMAIHRIRPEEKMGLAHGHYPELPPKTEDLLGVFDQQDQLLAMAKKNQKGWSNVFVVAQH
jgi:tRNA pseudouridine55 synthase